MPDGRFQGKRCSDEWDVILTDAARRVTFQANSLRRLLSEQWSLFRQNMQFVGGRWVQRPGRPLTAFPRPGAPHLKKTDHSLDIDSFVGDGENALERELERMGLVMVNDVAGESWHMTCTGDKAGRGPVAALKHLAAKIEAVRDDDTPKLYRGMKPNRTAVRRLQRLLRGLNMKGVPLNGKYDVATRTAVRRFQRKHKIPLDSKTTVGDKTWAALRKASR